MSTRNVGEFQYIIKTKYSILIQARIRSFLIRKKIKKEIIARKKASIIINNQCRIFLKHNKYNKNIAAAKIQNLFKRNHAILKREKLMGITTQNWLNKGKKEPTRNFAATTIQRYWLQFKHNRKLNKNLNVNFSNTKENIIQQALVKSKFCFICKHSKAAFICRDCGNINYCKLDFERFHAKGHYKNHVYYQIDSGKDYKFGANMTGDISTNILKLKDYLKINQIVLYEHFKLWDFLNNNTIKLRHLKDSLNVRFFKFDSEIKETIVNLSFRFIDDYNALNLNECFVNYEELFLRLI